MGAVYVVGDERIMAEQIPKVCIRRIVPTDFTYFKPSEQSPLASAECWRTLCELCVV